MSQEMPLDDPELTENQLALVAALSEQQLREIDEALLDAAGKNWRKVAMVVAVSMQNLPNRVEGIPDVFYSQRVARLVEQGYLISQGNLKSMRFSEVKVP